MSKKVLLAVGGTILIGAIAVLLLQHEEPVSYIELEVETATTTSVAEAPLKPGGATEAAKALRALLPRDEESLDALVGSYYDITLFYGSYEQHSIFDDMDSPYDFVEAYVGPNEVWEDRVIELHKIFKMAFVLPDSPAYAHEFMYPNGPGSGGEIVGRKQIDANTVIAYTKWTGAEHMGPSAYECKEYQTNIDRFTFKKVNGEWWVWNIEEDIDYWLTGQRVANDQPCEVINEDRLEKYKTGSF